VTPYPVNVRKADGQLAPFDADKLRASLRRSGAAEVVVEEITARVMATMDEGVSTKRLYREAFRLLRGRHSGAAARYNLRRAIFALGPSGYPFERYIAGLMAREGYDARAGVTLQGRFVRHEIDVDATRGDRRRLVECKFKNSAGQRVDVKVALYVYARSLDLRAGPERYETFWLVTNTKFTSDARTYGVGVGLRLLGWDFPEGDELPTLVRRLRYYPITALTCLSAKQKRSLLERGAVGCDALVERPALLDGLGLSASKRSRAMEEAEFVSTASIG